MSFLSSIPFLSTAIAIIISWALFAILCSLIYEGYAQLKAERGRFMKNYLFKQLQDLPNGVNWASLLYLHGPVDLLSRADNKPTNEITPRLFAESIIEIVGSIHLVKTKVNELQSNGLNNIGTSEKIILYSEDNSLQNFKLATELLKQSDVVSFFKQSINNAEMKAANAATGTIDKSLAYQFLLSNLENWYTDFTNRLTLWYKKKTRLGLFVIGVLLALLINIDSLQLFDYYNKYPDAKNEVITYYQNNASSLNALATYIDSLNNNKTSPANTDSVLKLTKNYIRKTDSLKSKLVIPVGWRYNIFHRKENPETNLLLKLIGILISGFAASFGAPFWFELLKKIYTKN